MAEETKAQEKATLSREILEQQRREIVAQINQSMNETEQLKGVLGYVNGLLKTYDIPSIPQENKENK